MPFRRSVGQCVGAGWQLGTLGERRVLLPLAIHSARAGGGGGGPADGGPSPPGPPSSPTQRFPPPPPPLFNRLPLLLVGTSFWHSSQLDRPRGFQFLVHEEGVPPDNAPTPSPNRERVFQLSANVSLETSVELLHFYCRFNVPLPLRRRASNNATRPLLCVFKP